MVTCPQVALYATSFMSFVLSLVYSNCDCDAILFAGDVNFRIGKCNDCIEGIDNVPQRQILNEVKNTH